MKDSRADDLRLQASAQMHEDAFDGLTDAEAGERIGRSRRTNCGYRNAEPGARNGVPDSVLSYMLSAPNPWRVAATIEAVLKQKIVREKSDERLIDDYWLLRMNEPQVEAYDRAFDSAHPDSWTWMERARARKRDVAVNAELGAHEMEIAARGMTWKEVLARRPAP